MERLKYIVENNTIVELFGIQNFTNSESALLELIKNAYDARATKLDITIGKDEICIVDNGIGMSMSDIKGKWMEIGKSDKGYEEIDEDGNKRIMAGSKGIGRLALARLGSEVTLYTKKKNESIGVKWYTDWIYCESREFSDDNFQGTKIYIKKIRDKWNMKDFNSLIEYVSKTYNDESMKITIVNKEINKMQEIKPYFRKAIPGVNCTSVIKLKYISCEKKLECSIHSDEFLEEAAHYCNDINLSYYSKIINCYEELNNKKQLDIPRDELSETLEDLGDFEAEFYFSIKESNSIDKEKFLYKHTKLQSRFSTGVILYRNAFSISSFEGSKDWLSFGKRVRLSPAVATHPTGSWRVRENQIAGKVCIDKKANIYLKDISNRQGLEENNVYKVFINIIHEGISEFERYRQSIIRKINQKNIVHIPSEEEKIVDKVIKNPTQIKNFSNEQVLKFVEEIKNVKKENISYKKEKSDTEQRYKYDVRILNVLATSGLKASSMAHELHNDRNTITENYDNVVNALIHHDLWEFLNGENQKVFSFANVPLLLEKNKRINEKVSIFMSSILSDMEKERFIPIMLNINETLNQIKSNWERDYSWIRIVINIDTELLYFIPEDVINVIFDNLILNSIQHNGNLNNLIINITVKNDNQKLEIEYRDSGNGLDGKYRDNPYRILEVHETSRRDGHGLGMWIVNNTIVMSGGRIQEIDGYVGFGIKFQLGAGFSG